MNSWEELTQVERGYEMRDQVQCQGLFPWWCKGCVYIMQIRTEWKLSLNSTILELETFINRRLGISIKNT